MDEARAARVTAAMDQTRALAADVGSKIEISGIEAILLVSMARVGARFILARTLDTEKQRRKAWQALDDECAAILAVIPTALQSTMAITFDGRLTEYAAVNIAGV